MLIIVRCSCGLQHACGGGASPTAAAAALHPHASALRRAPLQAARRARPTTPPRTLPRSQAPSSALALLLSKPRRPGILAGRWAGEGCSCRGPSSWQGSPPQTSRCSSRLSARAARWQGAPRVQAQQQPHRAATNKKSEKHCQQACNSILLSIKSLRLTCTGIVTCRVAHGSFQQGKHRHVRTCRSAPVAPRLQAPLQEACSDPSLQGGGVSATHLCAPGSQRSRSRHAAAAACASWLARSAAPGVGQLQQEESVRIRVLGRRLPRSALRHCPAPAPVPPRAPLYICAACTRHRRCQMTSCC